LITAAITNNPQTERLLSGAVAPALTWDLRALGPGDLFFRQLKFAEFDVSELSMSSLAIGVSRGDRTWLALPIFTTGEFFHTGIIVRDDSAATSPADLRGKRVGVLEYQQTSVVWIRGVLHDEFGIEARDLTWYMERRPEKSHGGATGFAPPEGVALHYIPEEKSLAGMLAAGELDAVLFFPPMIDGIDFKAGDARETLRWRFLFPEPEKEAKRYFDATGIVPINHGVVVRRTLLESQPELAAKIYRSFVDARTAEGREYGVKANLKTLQTLLRYLDEQQLTARRLELSDLFVPESLEW
jgi:4,5-dihydroxyphthalate decarboxylase